MKIAKWLQAAVIATASCITIGGFSPANANIFQKTEVDPNDVIAVAVEHKDGKHKLLIVEQISDQRACWSEKSSESLNRPVLVDTLLRTFDFTGICRRSTDSNGYSIRMDDQDLGSDYLLTLLEREGEIVLAGIPRPWAGRGLKRIEVGRTRGYATGNEKIFLDPGWRFTKRTYQGRVLGHFYLTYDSAEGTVTQPNTIPELLPPTDELDEPIDEPVRELIFEPQSGIEAPTTEATETSNQTPATSSTSERTVPVLVVPVR
ncbi:MAG: DUF3747 domain-containing protein [Symploca sp. SIO2E6]|nr:DUF3747 domain-containing protein [Symploca sp. SIO2E6]